jgi:hypothetical protein
MHARNPSLSSQSLNCIVYKIAMVLVIAQVILIGKRMWLRFAEYNRDQEFIDSIVGWLE